MFDIPHGNFNACYDISIKYLRITQDETMILEISPQQFRICQEANEQFCTIPTPFPTPNFHLPPHYEGPPLEVNIFLDMANLSMINISSINFYIWQQLEKHQNESQLQHLASIPLIPGGQLYSHMAKGIQHIKPFSPEESTGYTDSLWTLFTHTGVYVMVLRSLIPTCLGIFCCYFFWSQPVRLAHWPLQTGTKQYTIVGDDVEAAPIYRCDGKASHPARPHKNHGLHMEHIPTWIESQCKQQRQSLVVPAQGSLANMSKIQGTQKWT